MHGGCLWSARHLSGQVAHPLTLLECPKLVSSYLGRVDKDVRPAVVERNGPEIVSSVEPVHDPTIALMDAKITSMSNSARVDMVGGFRRGSSDL